MTPQQEHHLQSIKDRFELAIDAKYRAGQKEHGGNLWTKTQIIDMAIEETIDLMAYLYSLKDQIEEAKCMLGKIDEKKTTI